MKMDDGVWRTISGRKVFIKNGQSLGDAMKASGKFKNYIGGDISERLVAKNDYIAVNNTDEMKAEVKKYADKKIKEGYKDSDIYGELNITEKNSFGEDVKSFGSHYGLRDINQFIDIHKDSVDYISLQVQRGTDNKDKHLVIDIQKNTNNYMNNKIRNKGKGGK